MRKYHDSPKNVNVKHPQLPRPTAKPNHYKPNNQVSLFSNQPKKEYVVTTQQNSTPSSVPFSPIASQHKASPPSVVGAAPLAAAVPQGGDKDKKNPKLMPSLDPLQSCYGTRSRPSQMVLQQEVGKDNDTDNCIMDNTQVPRSILSNPSSPAVSGKKKVTFNLEARASSSSYTPPSRAPPFPVRSSDALPCSSSSSAGRSMRPSFSDQLSAIADKAGEVTADIKAKSGMSDDNKFGEKPLLTTPAKNFTVGHLQCRYPAPVDFFSDRFEYTFHHPFQNSEIRLTVYYRDMVGASLAASPAPGKLIFRVPRHLVHFAADYDPGRHYVALFLASGAAVQFVKTNIMPKLLK